MHQGLLQYGGLSRTSTAGISSLKILSIDPDQRVVTGMFLQYTAAG